MKEYEIIHEIFNKCSGNQMRDVFVTEEEVADPEAYVRSRHGDSEIIMEKTVMPDGVIIFDLNLSGQKQRYSFTEI